jgi:DHA1 family bicyclomycin/chloramphenicol resistance-like MFS transporter
VTVAARSGGRRVFDLLVLGGLSAFGALSVDMYLPALPQIADHFGAGSSVTQLSITTFAAGLGAAQLVVGPLSDRFGRRRPLLLSLVAYVIASLGCALAPTIGVLIACRFVQGAASGGGMVLARAIVRDRHSGHQLVRYFSLLMLVTGAAPILAPTIGAQVLRFTSWRGVFLLLLAVGALLLAVAGVALHETHPPERRHVLGPRALAGSIGALARERRFMGYVLTLGFINAAMFAYIAAAPFVFEDMHHVSPQAFSLIFGVNAAGLIAVGQIVRVFPGYVTPPDVLHAGVVMCCIGATSFLVVTILDLGLPAILPSLFLVVASVGAVSSTIPALALSEKPQVAGAASGMIGASQLLFGAAIAPVVGLAGRNSAFPLAISVGILAWGALALLRGLVGCTPARLEGELGLGRPNVPD